MKVKILAALFVVAMIFSLTACGGGSSDAPVVKNEPEISTEPTSPMVSPEGTDTTEQETESGSGYYSNKVYYVGEDIPAGGYIVNCTGTDCAMDVVVFASSEDYQSFQNAKKFTVGEYSEAVELNAWANFYLEQDEKAYVGLRDGYIILLDDGRCEFGKYDASVAQTLYSGIYVVGEDINAAKINVKCTSDYLQVTLFESKDKYLEYHKTSRFTVGEESDAIEQYAESTEFIYTDNSTYAKLPDGMVMMVEEGTGEYSVDSGPIIN